MRALDQALRVWAAAATTPVKSTMEHSEDPPTRYTHSPPTSTLAGGGAFQRRGNGPGAAARPPRAADSWMEFIRQLTLCRPCRAIRAVCDPRLFSETHRWNVQAANWHISYFTRYNWS